MSRNSLPKNLKNDARGLALKAFRALRQGKTSQEALDGALAGSSLPQAEKNLASELFYGVCRNRIRLDYIANKFLAKPASLPAAMQDILNIALYSLLFQQKIPAYAAINSAVEQVSQSYGKLSAVANGFLRNAQRRKDEIENPAWYENGTFAGQAIYYSIPLLVAELWQSAYGLENAMNLLQRSNKRPWSGLLPGPAASKDVLLQLEKACDARLDNGFCFAPGCLPENTLALRNAGQVFSQAPASWHILHELGLDKWQEPVWDCCAGFGGKTLALLRAGVNVELCSDVSEKRLSALAKNCEKFGVRVPGIMQADAARASTSWDGNIMLDVPCSGLGVLGRRPDIVAGREKFAELRKLQGSILAGMAAKLQPGRKLAYITCTLNPVENELAAREFLAENSNFSLCAEWQTPHEHLWLDGMYGVVLERKS